MRRTTLTRPPARAQGSPCRRSLKSWASSWRVYHYPHSKVRTQRLPKKPGHIKWGFEFRPWPQSPVLGSLGGYSRASSYMAGRSRSLVHSPAWLVQGWAVSWASGEQGPHHCLWSATASVAGSRLGRGQCQTSHNVVTLHPILTHLPHCQDSHFHNLKLQWRRSLPFPGPPASHPPIMEALREEKKGKSESEVGKGWHEKSQKEGRVWLPVPRARWGFVP